MISEILPSWRMNYLHQQIIFREQDVIVSGVTQSLKNFHVILRHIILDFILSKLLFCLDIIKQ